ncbi:hypothetical protein V1506DRAFT_550358 [Lipomyces tetrasporus]
MLTRVHELVHVFLLALEIRDVGLARVASGLHNVTRMQIVNGSIVASNVDGPCISHVVVDGGIETALGPDIQFENVQ